MATMTHAPPTTIRAAVYVRISDDRTGAKAGVGRQRSDCADLCERRGWQLVEVFEDNDISASTFTRKRRPAYASMVAAVEAGHLDAVVAWDIDRLYRRPRELEDLIDLAERLKDRLTITTIHGDLDLSTGDGRAMARVLVAMSAKSSDDTSRRVLRAKEEAATEGRPHGGTRPYGYKAPENADGTKRVGVLEVVPEEAEVVKEAVARVLSGDTLTSIARDLNARGVRAAQGGKWAATSLRRAISKPALAALRVYRGEVVGDAGWLAIISRGDHERLRAMLDDPGRRAVNPPRRSLLTGLVRCGKCGEVMFRDSARTGASLRCKAVPGSKGCGGSYIMAEPTEALVVEAVIQRLDSPQLAATLAGAGDEGGDEVEAELIEVEARMAELSEMFAAGDITRAEWMRARRGLEARQTAARAALSRRRRTTAVDAYAGRPGALRAAWKDLNLDQRRAIVTAVVDRVEIGPARRRNTFDEDRIDIKWA